MSSPVEIPAPFLVADFSQLVAAIKVRRCDLGLSQLHLDEKAGLASGYVGKLEASLTNPAANNARSIGKESLPLLLGAVRCKLALVPDGTATLAPRLSRTEAGRKGGKARLEKMTPAARTEVARRAGLASAAKRAKAKRLTLLFPQPDADGPAA